MTALRFVKEVLGNGLVKFMALARGLVETHRGAEIRNRASRAGPGVQLPLPFFRKVVDMSHTMLVRFLMEVWNGDRWVPEQILCQFLEHRSALKFVNHIARERKKSANDFRIKRLLTNESIADAKKAVYRESKR